MVEWLGRGRRDCTVTSGEPALLQAVRERLPRQATGLVSMKASPLRTLESCDCSMLVAHWETVSSPAWVRRFRERGIHVSTWTVNDATVIRNLHAMQVDSVITDYVSMALPLVAALER